MKYHLSLLLAVGLLGCNTQQNTNENTGTETSSALTFQPENYSHREGKCDSTGSGQGVNVRATYMLLGGTSRAVQSVNDTLKAYMASAIANFLDSAEVARNPQARTDLNTAAHLFAASYKAFRKEFSDAPVGGCWEVEVKGDTLYSSPEQVSFRMETYAYTGGAHPNTVTTFYTFDRATGSLLHLTDIVSDTTRLLTVAEKYFRKKQGLLPNQDLENEGYFLNNGRFFLPQNIAPTREGLLLYYNPYEIAAYVFGPIEFVVPYQELK